MKPYTWYEIPDAPDVGADDVWFSRGFVVCQWWEGRRYCIRPLENAIDEWPAPLGKRCYKHSLKDGRETKCWWGFYSREECESFIDNIWEAMG